MSLCQYCGQKGWFQDSHPACVEKVQSTAKTVKAFVIKTILGGGDFRRDVIVGVHTILSDNNINIIPALTHHLCYQRGVVAS
jgi:hypothetical protein